jgi:hypothetical protein
MDAERAGYWLADDTFSSQCYQRPRRPAALLNWKLHACRGGSAALIQLLPCYWQVGCSCCPDLPCAIGLAGLIHPSQTDESHVNVACNLGELEFSPPHSQTYRQI